MDKKILDKNELEKYFLEKEYNCLKPHSIVNNNDTIFVSAGIQPILKDYCEYKINECEKIYIAQPVIRTQFANSVSEGSSIAFVNLTTSGFNITEEKHNILVQDFFEIFSILNMKKEEIVKKEDEYEDIWGSIQLSGKRTFYYYKNIEIGDTTFFTKILKGDKKIGIETMSDVGFGLERIRWLINGGSYFNLYSDSAKIDNYIKAYLSVLSLLRVNDIKPSNKNCGYRARLFSKKLVNLLKARPLSFELQSYLIEALKYWKNWQDVNHEIETNIIEQEYIRNCNRYIIDILLSEGYDNLSGININVSWEEFQEKLLASNVEPEKIKKLLR